MGPVSMDNQTDKGQLQKILEKGESLLKGALYDRAMVEFQKALRLDKSNAHKRIKELFRKYQGKAPEAIVSLGTNLYHSNPDDLELAAQLGHAQRLTGNWKEAVVLYRHCIQTKPSEIKNHYNLAATLAHTNYMDGDAVTALAEYEKLKSFKLPQNKVADSKILKLQTKVQNSSDTEGGGATETHEIAKQETHEEGTLLEFLDGKGGTSGTNPALEMKPNKQKASGESFRKIDFEAIFNHLCDEPGRESPEFEDLVLALGIRCLHEEEGFAATKAFNQLLVLQPNNIDYQSFGILARSINGDEYSVVEGLKELLKTTPCHRYSHINLGLHYLHNKEMLKARTHFFICCRLLEQTDGEYSLVAYMEKVDRHFAQDHTKKALQMCSTVLDQITDQDMLLRVGSLFLNDGDVDLARDSFLRVLKLGGKESEARDGLKKVHQACMMQMENFLKNKDLQSAVDTLEKAMKLFKTPKLVQRAIDLYRMLGNDSRVIALEKYLQELDSEVNRKKVNEKIEQAANAEKENDFKRALQFYDEAIRIEPQHRILVMLVDLCNRFHHPELVENIEVWFQQQVQNKKK